MMAEQKKTGRPVKTPQPGTRVSLGLKVTPRIKERIDWAARESGRTQSQEAEARLERSFDQQDLLPELLTLAYGRQLAGLSMLIASAMLAATWPLRSVSFPQDEGWLNDSRQFDLAARAATAVLEAARPAAVAEPDGTEDADKLIEVAQLINASNLDQAAKEVVNRLIDIVTRAEPADRSPDALAIGQLLGPVADRLAQSPTKEADVDE